MARTNGHNVISNNAEFRSARSKARRSVRRRIYLICCSSNDYDAVVFPRETHGDHRRERLPRCMG